MNIIKQTLAGSSSTNAVSELSRAFGTSPDATRAAVASVVDEFTNRLERNTLSRGGLAELVRAVGDTHHEAYLRDPSLLRSASMEQDGKAILDHVFWSKDKSRAVAAHAARASGLPASVVEDMMPSIAALSMAELTQAAAGPFDDILRRIPGLDEVLQEMQRQSRDGQSRDGDGFEPRNAPGRGSSGDYDSIPGMPETRMPKQRPPYGESPPREPGHGGTTTGSIPEQRPLPMPGEAPMPDEGSSRYDDLSDILRRGGFKVPGGGAELPDSIPGGNGGIVTGTLSNIIRAILGALLGFQSRGFLGWVIRLIVVRWGWGFLQRILGRVLGRVLTGR